jgi:pimeloyl-ACP methyl ester carboxylesterase
MHRSLLILLAACTTETVETAERAVAPEVSRTQIAGDIYHYRYIVPVGTGPNAQLHVHRIVREDAPNSPIKTKDAIALMHGDFATFTSNFLPMATWLADEDIDVWGIDRRWTQQPRFGPDLTGFDEMGLDQELADIDTALAFVRAQRHGNAGVTLAGFSRGGQLAYYYASREALRPPGLRHVKGLVSLDVYASLAEHETELRQFYCQSAADEYQALADGLTNIYNVFQLTLGLHYLQDPTAPSPWDDVRNRREMMLWLVGQTYAFFPATPVYHLNGPVLDETGTVTGLRFSSELDVANWLAASAPHQSMRESADTDAILCGDTSFDVPLSRIDIPLLSIAAAGGYGERANHSAAQVGSNDVQTIVIRQLPVEREAEDYGHADLLFASDAPTLAWEPLLTWLRAH